MRRRDFIAGLTGVVALRPVTGRAQRDGHVRRIGVLRPWSEDDALARPWITAFITALGELGWSEGRNLRMDVRWGAGNPDRVRMYAHELSELRPDLIFVESTPLTAALQRETGTIPIVFVIVSDPVGSGFVASLSHPGGNITGFSNQDPSLGGKWVELLADIAPNCRRVAAIFNPDTAPYVRSYYLPSFEAAARTLKLEPIILPVRDNAELEEAINSLGRGPGSAVMMPDAFLSAHRALIISLAVRNNVPAVSEQAELARDGLLISYGPDFADLYRRSAPYVDRILRGAHPAELPVQLPVKFVMALNTKTAKTLGLTIPPNLLAIADEVIE
jgi:putative tryptophan/tyrosine transport system substrate-binding protein